MIERVQDIGRQVFEEQTKYRAVLEAVGIAEMVRKYENLLQVFAAQVIEIQELKSKLETQEALVRDPLQHQINVLTETLKDTKNLAEMYRKEMAKNAMFVRTLTGPIQGLRQVPVQLDPPMKQLVQDAVDALTRVQEYKALDD